MESAKKFVHSTIQKNCVVIFTKPSCPHCRKAVQIFDKLGTQYQTVDISKRKDVEDVQNVFRSMTGAHTVPRVFINGKCIGGGQETRELYENNALHSLIEKCSFR